MAEGKEGEGQGEGGKEGEGEKGGKKDPVQARIDAEVARRHKAEQELETLKKSQAERDEAALREQKKFEELYGKAKPRAELADELEKSVQEYLASELSDLSDEHKALIPEMAPHKQLAWVKKAKAAGAFGKQDQPHKTFDGKPKSKLPPEKWYLELEEGDERVGTLTSAQYAERKAHRKAQQPAAVVVRGGF